MCVVDGAEIVREGKVASEREALTGYLGSLGFGFADGVGGGDR